MSLLSLPSVASAGAVPSSPDLPCQERRGWCCGERENSHRPSQTQGGRAAQMGLQTWRSFSSQKGPVKSLMPWGRDSVSTVTLRKPQGAERGKWGIFKGNLHSVQFSSVAQSCPTLCDPMSRSTPGLPVHHQQCGLKERNQTAWKLGQLACLLSKLWLKLRPKSVLDLKKKKPFVSKFLKEEKENRLFFSFYPVNICLKKFQNVSLPK